MPTYGSTSVLDQGYANQSQDFTPVVLAVRQSGADILGTYFTFETDLGIFARQLRQLGVTVPWVGSPSIVNLSALKLAGPALYNTYGVADYAEDSSDAAKAFGKAYQGGAQESHPTTSPPGPTTPSPFSGDGDQQGRQD